MPPKKDMICDLCGGRLYQRPDDKEVTIKKRLKVYNNEAKALIKYYKRQGKLEEVPADFDADKLYDELTYLFKEKKKL